MSGMSRRGEWWDAASFEMDAGVRQWSGTDRATTFELRIKDGVSGLPVLELELSAEDTLRMFSGSMMTDVKGKIAKASVLGHLNHVPMRDQHQVPPRVTDRLYGDKAVAAAQDWFDGEPGSGEVDSSWARKNFDDNHYTIHTITYVSLAEAKREQQLTEDSETPDFDDAGLEDIDDD